MVECSFFIPVRRDRSLSDGALHSFDVWDWLDGQLFGLFRGATKAPGIYRGFYQDPDTLEKVDDESTRYFVALPKRQLNRLRRLLKAACTWFQQKCIYLSDRLAIVPDETASKKKKVKSAG